MDNLGRASTSNATVRYIDDNEVKWTSELFGVNATNNTQVLLDTSNLVISGTGYFDLYYQKRVIDASLWVNESIPRNRVQISDSTEQGFLPLTSPMLAIMAVGLAGMQKREATVVRDNQISSGTPVHHRMLQEMN